jgi:hypothetical protein
MILEYGPIEKLQGLPWYMVEVRSEKTIESTMRRVGNALHGIFRDEPIEIFIPVVRRDLDVFELSTQVYCFVRGTSTGFPALLRLKSVTGIVGLVTEGDTNRPSKALQWPDADVQKLISDAEEEHRKRAMGIEVGSFVRILNGETRDYCGVVEIIGDGKAVVRITLRTKSILLETPIRNLLNLGEVAPERRVYYYGPLVDQLIKDNPEDGPKLIEEDLHLDEPTPQIEVLDEPLPEHEPKKHSRQRTVTALVKKLVMLENKTNPMEIAKVVVESLKRGDIKAPKNLFIVYCIIKDHLMREHFRKLDPTIKNYREVIHKYGKEFKFSAQQIAALDPALGIPVQSADSEEDEPIVEEPTIEIPIEQPKKSRKKKAEAAAAEVKKIEKPGKKIHKKQRKASTDTCGECYHPRSEHNKTAKGNWARCKGKTNPKLHPWIEGVKPCWCKRFKEKAK